MIEAEAIIKRWGNSFGIVLPKPFIKRNRLSPNDKVHVVITKVDKKNVAKRLWGALPQWKTSSEELEKFVDKEFDLPGLGEFMYFFDTYAFWELLKKNPDYAPYSQTTVVCTIFNAYEFYVTLRKDFNEETAKKYIKLLEDCIVEVTIKNIIDAVEMKKRYNKQDISFIDCLGYLKAKELGLKFLTGDKEFTSMDNVEFVK